MAQFQPNTQQEETTDEEFDDKTEDNLPVSRSPSPSHIAARFMLFRALTACPKPRDILQQRGIVIIVEVPSTEWIAPVARVWGEFALGREAPPEWGLTLQTESHWSEVRGPEPKSHASSRTVDVISILSNGHTALGISHAPEKNLPDPLLRACDHRVTVAPPLPGDFAKIAQRITGASPSVSMPPDLCRLVSVADLLLAYRPSQTADDYLAKLRTLTELRFPKASMTLDQLHGMAEAVAWGESLAIDIRDYTAGTIPWSAVDKGACLYGPPGTGKTTFAKALAATCGLPLITGSLHQWQAAGHLGDLLGAMRKTFEMARKTAPSILFIDEIDAFGDRSSFSHDNKDYSVQVVNGFLEELDGANGRDGVVVVGACNHPGRMDPAITRSGRLDRMIPISLPDEKALADIFRFHIGETLPPAALSRAATLAVGSTGADVERWVRGAKRRARMERRSIAVEDLLAEIQETSHPDPDVIWRCAVHESGHAVCIAQLRPGALTSASIRQTGLAGGSVISKPDEAMPTRETSLITLVGLLGGRAAEEIVLGSPSSGSGGDEDCDLAKASVLATRMIASLGLDDESERGFLWLADVTTKNIDTVLRSRPSLEKKVSTLLVESYAKALGLLREHRAGIEAVASALVERKTIPGQEIEELLTRCQSTHADVR